MARSPRRRRRTETKEGIAYTRRESDGTTSIRFHIATGPIPGALVERITGLVTGLAKHGGVLAIGEAAHAAGAGLGRALALDGDVLGAGAPEQGDCGAVHVYARTSEWIELQEIDCPSATQVNADFGDTLAYDAGVLAVGAPRLDRPDPGGAIDAGGVYLYRSSLLLFELETFLRPPEAADGDQFGSSLALYGWTDGNVALLAGSPWADTQFVDAGTASLYLDWGTWRRQATLAIGEGPDTRLGASVALGRRGAVVGAPNSDGNFVHDQGSAFAWNGILPFFYDGFDRGDAGGWSSVAP